MEHSAFIKEAANTACLSLMPAKSKARYEKSYEDFCSWRKIHNVETLDESVLLAYFFHKVS